MGASILKYPKQPTIINFNLIKFKTLMNSQFVRNLAILFTVCQMMSSCSVLNDVLFGPDQRTTNGSYGYGTSTAGSSRSGTTRQTSSTGATAQSSSQKSNGYNIDVAIKEAKWLIGQNQTQKAISYLKEAKHRIGIHPQDIPRIDKMIRDLEKNTVGTVMLSISMKQLPNHKMYEGRWLDEPNVGFEYAKFQYIEGSGGRKIFDGAFYGQFTSYVIAGQFRNDFQVGTWTMVHTITGNEYHLVFDEDGCPISFNCKDNYDGEYEDSESTAFYEGRIHKVTNAITPPSSRSDLSFDNFTKYNGYIYYGWISHLKVTIGGGTILENDFDEYSEIRGNPQEYSVKLRHMPGSVRVSTYKFYSHIKVMLRSMLLRSSHRKWYNILYKSKLKYKGNGLWG